MEISKNLIILIVKQFMVDFQRFWVWYLADCVAHKYVTRKHILWTDSWNKHVVISFSDM